MNNMVISLIHKLTKNIDEILYPEIDYYNMNLLKISDIHQINVITGLIYYAKGKLFLEDNQLINNYGIQQQ